MPFRLDLLRHGDALPPRASGDAVRPLSDSGRRAVDRIAAEFERRRWRPDQIFASPLLRAQETAAIVAARARPRHPVETLEELNPASFPEEVIGALATRTLGPHVLLVGHQPLLGGLAAYLTGGPHADLSPGALACLEIARLEARGSGRLLDVLHPDHLA